MKNNEPDLYSEARRRVAEKAKFFKHLYFFLIFNALFLFMALRGRSFFPLIGTLFWGVGVAFHYLKVFGLPGSGVLSKEWEDREIHKEIKRMKGEEIDDLKTEEKMDLKELRKNYDESDFV